MQKWVKLSLRTIASRLQRHRHTGSVAPSVGWRKLGGLVKKKALRAQLTFCIRRATTVPARSCPVDTKNKELIGNFANQGLASGVNLHDFPGDALDIGYVYLGNSYDTPEFAAHAIAQWWADPARPRFPHEDKLLILCDAGGSNNCRSWLWKAELQRQCADRFGISVLVCHYPTGASKYNPIEYRVR